MAVRQTLLHLLPTTVVLRKQNLGSDLFIAICVVDCQKKDSEMGKLKELSVSVSIYYNLSHL
jgi:hypothetical protein